MLQPSNLEGTLSHQADSPGPPLTISIGLRRKERRTAFLSHWLTVQLPSSPRSATRTLPESSRFSEVSTASRTSPRVEVLIPSRSSKARSMVAESAVRLEVFIGIP